MTVYVDQFPEGWGRWTGGGHMLANDIDELHAMAAYIGLQRTWFQDKTFAHYDLVRSKRTLALKAGAVPVDFFEGMPDDVLMKNGDGTYETHAERMGRRHMADDDIWFSKRVNGRYIHNWPSNFWIEPDGTYVESEYQAEKHAGHIWREITITNCAKPGVAKKLGRHWALNRYQMMEWNNRKIAVMKELIRYKIEDHPEVAVALINTGTAKLVETNTWHDNFWGDCTCMRCYHVGENWLGQIWMDLRQEYV